MFTIYMLDSISRETMKRTLVRVSDNPWPTTITMFFTWSLSAKCWFRGTAQSYSLHGLLGHCSRLDTLLYCLYLFAAWFTKCYDESWNIFACQTSEMQLHWWEDASCSELHVLSFTGFMFFTQFIRSLSLLHSFGNVSDYTSVSLYKFPLHLNTFLSPLLRIKWWL